jgi:hypothetical protein
MDHMNGRVQLNVFPLKSDIVTDMRTISLSVSEKDYESFRSEAESSNRSIASLIREAMAVHLAMGPVRAGAEGAETHSLAGLPAEAVSKILAAPGRYEIIAEVREIS